MPLLMSYAIIPFFVLEGYINVLFYKQLSFMDINFLSKRFCSTLSIAWSEQTSYQYKWHHQLNIMTFR